MRHPSLIAALVLAATPLAATAAETLKVPFEYHKLDNGLKVVLSKDTTAPTATVTNGPTFFQAYLFHDKGTSPSAILDTFDTEVEKLRSAPVDQATLDLAKVKSRSWLYSQMEDFFGFGRANLLASFALFDESATRVEPRPEDPPGRRGARGNRRRGRPRRLG